MITQDESDGISIQGISILLLFREEERMHVHVYCSDGEAKFWVEPEVNLARNHGLSRAQIAELTRVVEDRKDEIADAWNKHFRNRSPEH
jgi:hypothetical protein